MSAGPVQERGATDLRPDERRIPGRLFLLLALALLVSIAAAGVIVILANPGPGAEAPPPGAVTGPNAGYGRN